NCALDGALWIVASVAGCAEHGYANVERPRFHLFDDGTFTRALPQDTGRWPGGFYLVAAGGSSAFCPDSLESSQTESRTEYREREFNAADTVTSHKVAIINESMAKEFLPNRNPLGVHIALGSGNSAKPDIEIVGVVKDVKQEHVRTHDQAYFFLPYSQAGGLF